MDQTLKGVNRKNNTVRMENWFSTTDNKKMKAETRRITQRRVKNTTKYLPVDGRDWPTATTAIAIEDSTDATTSTNRRHHEPMRQSEPALLQMTLSSLSGLSLSLLQLMMATTMMTVQARTMTVMVVKMTTTSVTIIAPV